MARYTTEHRCKILEVLARSAAENGGEPAWRTVEREVGVGRPTLRRWWAKREDTARPAAPVLRLAPPPRVTPDQQETLDDPLAAKPSAFHSWQFAQLQADLASAREVNSWGPAARFHELLAKSYTATQEALAAEGKSRKLSAEEVVQRLRELTREAPPDHAVAMAEELRKRGFA